MNGGERQFMGGSPEKGGRHRESYRVQEVLTRSGASGIAGWLLWLLKQQEK